MSLLMSLLVLLLVLPLYKEGSSYIAQYPVLRTVQSPLHFTSLTDMFTQTPSRLLWETSSHMLQLIRESCSYTHPPLSIARYSFLQLNELEQCRVKKLAQGFNTAAQDPNPGSRSRESEALPLSHSALQRSLLSLLLLLLVVVSSLLASSSLSSRLRATTYPPVT